MIVKGMIDSESEDFAIALPPEDAACFNILDENGENIAEYIDEG